MIKVISLDGGGVLGLMPALYLSANPHIARNAKLYAGTSTGALIALALAAGKSPSEIANLYRNKGGAIFKRGLRSSWPIFRERYSEKALEAALWEVFGSTRLSELETDVLITANDYTRKRNSESLQFFRRRSDGYTAFDAARATSAAPTYFKPYQINGRAFLDGALSGTNNPSLCALAEVTREWGASQDVHIVSIGTGIDPEVNHSKVPRRPWKFLDDVIDIGIGGSMGMVHEVMVNLSIGVPGLRYTRIDFTLDRAVAMDDARPETIAYLESRAGDDCVCIWENGELIKGLAA